MKYFPVYCYHSYFADGNTGSVMEIPLFNSGIKRFLKWRTQMEENVRVQTYDADAPESSCPLTSEEIIKVGMGFGNRVLNFVRKVN